MLYDIGEQGGVQYLVMEYLEGETLAARLLKGPLPLDQVLRYAIEISDTLDRTHWRGPYNNLPRALPRRIPMLTPKSIMLLTKVKRICRTRK